jgi:hypothetical protein
MMRSIIATALALAISAPTLAGRATPALAGRTAPALAQTKPHRSAHVEKAEAAPPRQSSIITSLSQWGEQDLAAAVALSTSIPELQDPVGSACWKSWSAAGAVVKAHPLPLSLKLATDVEAARLVAMAIKKVCMDPNCSQVWNDILNQVAALAIVPLPVSLTSICSRIP